MRPLFVPRRYTFVRVDTTSVILIPLLSLTVTVVLGHVLISMSVVKSVYSSPFVALCAFVSNRVCLRAGLITAAGSLLVHEFFFAAPYLELNWPSTEQGLAYAANFTAAYLVARRVPLPPQPPTFADLGAAALPFVGSTKLPEKAFWVVDGGQDWTEDCIVGAEYARLYLEWGANRTPLIWVVRDMVAAGRWTGVEAGFCSVIGRAAAIGRRQNRYLTSVSHDDADNLKSDRAIV